MEILTCQEVSRTILSSACAFCFMQFHFGGFEIPPDHVGLVSATVLVDFKFTSKLHFVLETFPSSTYSCIFFCEMTKPLYLEL